MVFLITGERRWKWFIVPLATLVFVSAMIGASAVLIKLFTTATPNQDLINQMIVGIIFFGSDFLQCGAILYLFKDSVTPGPTPTPDLYYLVRSESDGTLYKIPALRV